MGRSVGLQGVWRGTWCGATGCVALDVVWSYKGCDVGCGVGRGVELEGVWRGMWCGVTGGVAWDMVFCNM